jgi:outer membrane protein TolC
MTVRTALLGLLVACSAGTPRLHYPRGMYAALVNNEPPASPAADAKTMTLAEAYRLALARSETVALVGRNVVNAEINRRNAWTEVEPYVRATETGTVQRLLSIYAPAIKTTFVFAAPQASVGQAAIDQPLFRRDIGANVESAARSEESADASYERARQQLMHDVAAVCILVVRTRTLLGLAKDAVDRAAAQDQLAVARVKAGQSLRNAQLLADIDLARAQREEVAAEQDVSTADIDFQRLVGRPAPEQLVLPPIPDVADVEHGLDVAMHRTDLVALQLAADSARVALRGSQQRRLWPLLDLHAQMQYLDPAAFGVQSWNWQVVGTLTIPFFQNGTEYINIEQHETAIDIADLQTEQQRKLVVEQVKDASLQMASTVRETEFASKQREAARENYKLVDKQARLGAVTPLDVTNAQAVLTEAEQAFEVAQMDRMLAVYEYLFATGVLDLGAR